MFMSLSDILSVLEQYKYLLLFPVATLESITTAVVSGFIAHFGLLNVYATYVVLIIADLTGDSVRYLVGMYWRKSVWIKKYGHIFGYSEKSEKFLEDHFVKHRGKTLILAKLSPGFGTAVQVAAGIARIDFLHYIRFSFLITVPRTLFFFLFGYYAGSSYVNIDRYLYSYSIIIGGVILLIIGYKLSNKFIRNYFSKSNNVE
ncbi:MAG: hypothetical protein UU11_C0003G0051 [Parcubacteria group bacterium GW2011_GWF2_40_69]|nr:MAG: hypothetical protein UT68_C0006G0051 [Parcubacteria group bacterium GW2011_GWC2_40_10]KKR64908.1 MAG: hypothetical protein UU06_C0035G0005 [Parcubacteria group bacterium GW2011_GWB1_40_5]KKR69057.1 MAG: hypothetical protein UU11_C0003G0051 [Parcubacteria group bacterium GW2011_GWF2_40_69]KKR81639.1 MAG: hypothetical protein UU27_C0012G0014 [Parcubacteria group bacterium GW2011_GWD1_40_9]